MRERVSQKINPTHNAPAAARPLPSIVPRVSVWAEQNLGIQPEVWLSHRVLSFPLPNTVEPEVYAGFQDRATFGLRAKYLTRIPHARLYGKNGLIILPDGSFSEEIANAKSQLEADPAYLNPLPQTVVHKQGRYFSVLMEWANSGNYYHWVHDCIGRLFGVIERLPSDVQFIVPANLNGYQRETLALVGIEPARSIPYDGSELWELEELYFTPPTVYSGQGLPEMAQWLRELAWARYGLNPTKGTRRIFISRRRAARRFITNEAEVENFLQPFGFETCIAEELDWAGQVKLFADAEIVFSLHGAGLTNLLFAPPGATLIELFPPNFPFGYYCYWALCCALGHAHWYFVGKDVPNPQLPRFPDTLCPIDKLAATLERIGISPASTGSPPKERFVV